VYFVNSEVKLLGITSLYIRLSSVSQLIHSESKSIRYNIGGGGEGFQCLSSKIVHLLIEPKPQSQVIIVTSGK